MTIKFAAGQTDFYKMFHKEAYHPDITKVYSNYTSRNGRLSNVKGNDEVVFVGLQYFIKDVLIKEWNETFFELPKHAAIRAIKRITDNCLGFDYDASHFEALHDLGYLPISIKALPEGVSVPYGVPPVTFVNTVEGFQWLSNYIETVFSTENWLIQTSATTAKAYLSNTIKAFDNAGLPHDLIPFMCHDFSMRGMAGRHAAAMSGFGHLTSFAGTDTIPAILFAEKYYNANVENELVGVSVPATEHSTATSYITSMAQEKGITKLEAEVDYVRYLMTKVPTGILSHVSDSFDFWKFVSEGLPMLKEDILSREGKLVVRPDSGDPVKVLTGLRYENYEVALAEWLDKEELGGWWLKDKYEVLEKDGKYFNFEADSDYYPESPEYQFDKELKLLDELPEYEVKGLIECLGDIFGTTESPTGLKLLPDNIGAIYGDSITLARQQQIIERLEDKGYAALVVLGVGSYSYQYVTRDTHGSAVKATWVEKAGEGVDVFKDPKTDSKKKSAKGLMRIELEEGTYVMYDKQTREQEQQGELKEVFRDGKLLLSTTLAEIRQRVKNSIK
ncbi:nicotinate phosphoribosyltransferase familyprotein [Vibrio phage 496E54-1]|nr:nicotinate phosphoribosyltransferase familyprotein [Vibrio phage 496E54-1]